VVAGASVCCSMLQCVAACCSRFIYVCGMTYSIGRMESVVAVCCSMLQRDAAASFTCVTLDVLQGG